MAWLISFSLGSSTIAMFKIPDEFRDTPEAAKVREATARFEAAIEQAKRIAQQSGERVHLDTGQFASGAGGASGSTECFRLRHGRAKAGRADACCGGGGRS